MTDQAKYYHFRQNNSGGSFVINDRVAHHMVIQAYSAEDANSRALGLGIYFDGCETGEDCECCGDRWYPQESERYATDVPLVHRDPPEKVDDFFTPPGQPVCHVYHLDGSKTTYHRKGKEQ